MKTFCVVLFAVTLLSVPVLGSPLDCETIRDGDQRNYCRAISKKDASWCEFIHNHDLRQLCRAQAR